MSEASSSRFSRRRSRQKLPFDFAAAATLVLVGLILGGASPYHAFNSLVIQLAAVACLVFVALAWPDRETPERRRLWILGVVAMLYALLQTVPLPPAWWTAMPGNAPAVAALKAAGISPGWQPWSITPVETFQSALAFMIALSMALIVLSLDRSMVLWLLWILFGMVAVSAVLGLAQVSSGSQSPLYFYDITNRDSAVGFFANANHFGSLMVTAIPLAAGLAARAVSRRTGPRLPVEFIWLATICALAVLGMALSTSLAAILLAGVSLLGSGAILLPVMRGRLWRWILVAAGPIAIVSALAAAYFSPAISSLGQSSFGGGEMSREALWKITLAAIRDSFPTGTGFGSFELAFRLHENIDTVGPVYANHAHNDLLELTLTAGVPGLILLLLFLLWFGRAAWIHWSSRQAGDPVARGASIAIVVMLLHSLVDYPLRTMAMEIMFGLCCGLIARPVRASAAAEVTAPASKHLSV